MQYLQDNFCTNYNRQDKKCNDSRIIALRMKKSSPWVWEMAEEAQCVLGRSWPVTGHSKGAVVQGDFLVRIAAARQLYRQSGNKKLEQYRSYPQQTANLVMVQLRNCNQMKILGKGQKICKIVFAWCFICFAAVGKHVTRAVTRYERSLGIQG